MKKGAGFLIVFLILWSTAVFAVDALVGRGLYQQWRSQSFVPTSGRVLSSEVTQKPGSKSTQYRAHVRYEYRVDGQRYESEVVRYGEMSDSAGKAARETVRANPVGSTRTVFYDPAAPSHAVLERNVSGPQLFVLVFLTPFNAMIFFLLSLVRGMRQPVPPAGGATIRPVSGQLHVSYKRFSRLGVAVGIFALVSFFGIFVLGFGWQMAPPANVALSVWGVAAALAALAVLPRGDGTADLTIDAQQGVVSLRHAPLGSLSAWREWKRAGRPRLGIPFERISGVEVRERVSKSSDGDTRNYVPVLMVKDRGTGEDTATEYDLGTWLTEEHARAFAQWLRETLGLKSMAPGVDGD